MLVFEDLFLNIDCGPFYITDYFCYLVRTTSKSRSKIWTVSIVRLRVLRLSEQALNEPKNY